MLAKKISVFLEDDDTQINVIYNSVKKDYVDRSEAVHEGIVSIINRNSVNLLRNLIRRIIMEEFVRIEAVMQSNPALTFCLYKTAEITRLKQIVDPKNTCGVFFDL